MAEISKYLEKIIDGNSLSIEESSRVFQIIAKNAATPAQIGAVLAALGTKNISSDEIAGAVKAMQKKMIPLNLQDTLKNEVVDNCGTGGDKKGTYNISTAASFVIAAAGIPVAKHGNRSVSSKSGSADVLEELGVNIDLTANEAKKCLEEIGICFLFARSFHPAMKIVAPVRREMGVRTIFNILGPLLNPASPKHQVIGVYSRELVPIICNALKELGHKHSMVVHGAEGLDEISVCEKTFIAELKDGKIEEYEITPEQFDLKAHSEKDLQGGDVKNNATALNQVLSGENSAYADAVKINAAAGIYIAGKAKNLTDGVSIAKELISSGKAKEKLKKLVEISGSF